MTSLGDGSVAVRRRSTLDAQGSLAGASEREETSMTVPNAGPLQPDPSGPEGAEARRGNPALVYRAEPLTGGMEAASTRASTVSHRFGGARHPLTRPHRFPPVEQDPNDGGDPDASH